LPSLLLVTISAAPWWPQALGIGALALLLIVGVKWRLFLFYAAHRGPLFAAAALPMCCVHLLVCGIGFAFGVVLHIASDRAPGGGSG
jgi:hypothetical protein